MPTLLRLLSRLPLPILYLLAHVIYLLTYHVIRYRRAVVHENLENSFPEKSLVERRDIAKQFYRNYSDVLVEMLKTLTIGREQLVKRVKFSNLQLLREFLDNKQSVIVMLAHQCNIDWLLLACDIELSYPMDAVYKPMHDKAMDKLVLEARSRFGGRPIAAKNTLAEIVKRRGEVRCYAIVPDQTPRREDEKFWAYFLNQDTAFFLGVEKIARLTSYPVLFMAVERSRRGYYQATLKIIAIPPYSGHENFITQRYVREVETQIKASPSNWLWSHRRWKHKKPLYA